jgi:predicted DNA binding CopG/RHH family protein
MSVSRKPSRKAIPRFANEDEEREFWASHDTADYFDWSKAVRATFPELKPSTTTISLRMPASMLEELKTLANERDVPYQSLMKVFLAERIARERGSRRPFRAPLARHSRESGNPGVGPPRARG